MKELWYLPVEEPSYLPVAISLHLPVNLACGLLRNWLPAGWLGKVTVEWYGPTVTGRPLPVSVQVAPAATQAPCVVVLPSLQVPFVFGRPLVSWRWQSMQTDVMIWPRFVLLPNHRPPASPQVTTSVA